MDNITSFFISAFDTPLNCGFICNLMIFTAVLEAIGNMISHFASLGRD